MGSKTNDELISLLYQIIDSELEKPDEEIDEDLIAECSDFIEELDANQPRFSKEQLDEKLRSLYAKAEAENTVPLSLTHTHKNQLAFPKRESKQKLRWIWITAAALIIASTITVAATTDVISKAWEYISTNIQRITGMKAGDTIDENGITIVKNSGSQTYQSIEELLEQEHYNILYPSELPNGIYIKKVIQTSEGENRFTLGFQTTSNTLSISISNYYKTDIGLWTDYTMHETESCSFYVKQLSDNVFQAVAQHDQYEYGIIFDDYAKLISILNNMKGIEK